MHVARVPRAHGAAAPQHRRQIRPVRVCAIQDPYSTLGVPADADQCAIKKAFRKLALKFHPDVASDKQTAEVKFLKLTAAYEYLIGKLRGKDMSDFFDEQGEKKDQAGSWDFHDWYWQFRINRSWGKQKRQSSGADVHSSVADACQEESTRAQQKPAFEPGFKTPEARQHLRTQLSGLRERAARRATRPSVSSSSDAEARIAHSPPSSPSSRFAATAFHSSSMSESDENDEDFDSDDMHDMAVAFAAAAAGRNAQSASSSEPRLHHGASSTQRRVTPAHASTAGGDGDSVDNVGLKLPLSFDMSASFEELWGGQGQEHEAFNKRYVAPSHGASSDGGSQRTLELVGAHVREAAAQQHEQPLHRQSNAASSPAASCAEHSCAGESSDGDSDCAAAGASCGHGFAAQYRATPRFASTQDRRDAVTHQLAGLRRKANIVMQHRSA